MAYLIADSTSSVAFAGLTYLSLFLATKLSATIPFLPPPSSDSARRQEASMDERTAAAAPPLYLLVVTLIPMAAAIYIASTRFTDYKHAGFDVLFGSVEGLLAAWFAFRFYHLPVRRGAGWAWGPRHRSAAFGIGTGVGSYGVHAHAKKGLHSQRLDVEQGTLHATPADVELRDLGSTGTTGGSYESQRALV